MEYQNYKKGLCDSCDGNVQVESGVYYCVECKKRWTSEEWLKAVKKDRELDYQFADYDENLRRLNSI